MWRYPLSDIEIDQQEIDAVAACLRSGWLTMGRETEAFEEEFAQFLGIKHAIALSSGTAALQLAYHLLKWKNDLQPGFEVIMPSLTFVATANALCTVGGVPKFVDIITPLEPTIDPSAIEKAINETTKAITVVHYAGYPCRMKEISQIASIYNLQLIEDCAHSPGSMIGSRKIGTFGDMACFSFFPNKNLTTCEGGMLVTTDDTLATRARLLRSHGLTRSSWTRHKQIDATYDVVDFGYNFRIDEIRSALGREQLKKLNGNNQLRQQLTEFYREAFIETEEISIPFNDSRLDSVACHIMPVLIPSHKRSKVAETLGKIGIQTSIHYPPIHLFTAYRKLHQNESLANTELYSSSELTLPLYPKMRKEDVKEIADCVIAALC